MKVSDYVVKFLVDKGLKDIFMISGGGCIHLVDSIGKNKNINYICNLHEQGAAIAAEAYAQYRGFGCALVTTGPGGTNAITAVASAWLDSVPLMIISGQVQTRDMVKESGVRQRGFQELNLPEIVKSITKYAATVTKPEEIENCLESAYVSAISKRPGPVWVEIPLDVQNAEIPTFLFSYNIKDEHSISEQTIKNIISEFNNAKQPVLLLGNGAKNSNYEELIETLKIPTLTTWKAADFLDENNKFFIGRPGMVGQRAANFVQQKADFILCIGARLDCGQIAFNYENFAPNAVSVVVDIDKNELYKNEQVPKYPINTGAEYFISKLLTYKSDIVNKKEHKEWLKTAKQLKEKFSLEKESKGIPIYDFMFEISNLMKKGDVLIPGSSGMAAEVTLQSFKVKKGQRVINSPGLGAMGFGIPAAIGACIASGRKKTVCIEGDGSFFMNVQELEIIKRLNLPIKIFVLNNGGYESIRKTQDKFFNGNYIGSSKTSGLTLPSILETAISYKIEYNCVEVKKETDYDSKERRAIVLKSLLKINTPIICEVLLPENNEVICKTVSYMKKDGTFASKPMENLSPELSEEEFGKVMKNE